MITYFALQEEKPIQLEQNTQTAEMEWVNLTNPTQEECLLVAKKYNVTLSFIKAALDTNERPRAERLDDSVLIVTNALIQETRVKNNSIVRVCPVGIVITKNVVITVCIKEKIIENMLLCKILGAGKRLQMRLALSLLLHLNSECIFYLQTVNADVDEIEKTLYSSMQNKELMKMLQIEKALIYCITTIQNNHAVLEKIHNGTVFIDFTPEEQNLFNNVIIENKQASYMGEIISQILSSISGAFGAIVSNNLNKVMKILTGLTLVFMVPSIIGALYGMNVPIPGQSNEWAFYWLCSLGIGSGVAVLIMLKRLRWM